MKKLLALVLALVMSMSLVTISNAAFNDADEISYKEAVEVMAAVGVIKGYDNGDFGATDTLTRAQACKIIAYLDLGAKTADAIKGSGTVFTDVPATAWYAGYVEYCAGAGYVAGVGNGKFAPDEKVTGVQFAKMLLCALGYNAEIEGYTGTDYSLAIARDANKNDLFDDLSIVTSAALTREQAAQMALNALKADVVEYEGGTKVSTSDGTKVTVNAIRYNIRETDDYLVSGGDAIQQLAEKLYNNDLKLDKSGNTAFGAPANTWTYKGETVGDYADTPVATFTAKTSAADVAKALSGYKFSTNVASTSATTKKVENTTDATITADVDVTVTKYSGQSTSATFGLLEADKTIAKQVANRTANGKLVEFYANDDKIITDLVIVEYKTVEAGKVSTDKKTGDVSYVIDGVTYKDFADEDATDTISFVNAPAKGDIVTYTKIGTKVYVYPTTTADGVQTATKTKDGVQTITVSGTAYTVGAYAKSGTNFDNSTKGDSATYYFDQYGFVVHTDSKSTASTDYAYVIDVDADLKSSFTSKTPSVEAKVVLADGTVAVYDVELTKDSDTKNWYIEGVGDKTTEILDVSTKDKVLDSATSDIKGKVFGYTVKDGVISLEKLDLVNGLTNTEDNTVYKAYISGSLTKATSYTAGNASVLVNDSTVYVAYNTDKETATVYTGYDALPKSVNTVSAFFAVLKTGTTNKVGTATVVFFNVAATLDADATDEYVYVDGSYSTVVVDGKNKYEYTGYKADGSTVALISSSDSQAKGLYEPNKDGEISGSPKAHSDNALIIDEAALTVDGSMVKSGSNWYFITEDTSIVYVDDDLTEVDSNKGVLVLVKDTMDVDVIYVTAD